MSFAFENWILSAHFRPKVGLGVGGKKLELVDRLRRSQRALEWFEQQLFDAQASVSLGMTTATRPHQSEDGRDFGFTEIHSKSDESEEDEEMPAGNVDEEDELMEG